MIYGTLCNMFCLWQTMTRLVVYVSTHFGRKKKKRQLFGQEKSEERERERKKKEEKERRRKREKIENWWKEMSLSFPFVSFLFEFYSAHELPFLLLSLFFFSSFLSLFLLYFILSRHYFFLSLEIPSIWQLFGLIQFFFSPKFHSFQNFIH